MHRTGKLFATTMIAAAGAVSTALALSTSAAAEPAPAPVPDPEPAGLAYLQQLAANPATATELIQTFTSALGTPTAAVTPATSPPGSARTATWPSRSGARWNPSGLHNTASTGQPVCTSPSIARSSYARVTRRMAPACGSRRG